MWYQIRLSCRATEVTACEDTLLLAGAVSVSLQDTKEEPIFEPDLDTTPLWEFTDVLALFEHTIDIVPVKKFLKKHLCEIIYDSIQVESIAEKDWIKESMKDWKPLSFGEKLWICPSWEITKVKDTKTCILLDPGLAFGTGTHPTTRLCLEWLDSHPPLNDITIDYGCGSGILSIAALKLGAKKVFAVDHDIQALKSTEMNAEKNHISSEQISILLPKDLDKKLHQYSEKTNHDTKADLILANILALPLIELAPTFAELLHPKGKIVLSGILHSQEKDIVDAYTPWFTQIKVDILEEWLRVTAIRI